MGKPGTAPYPWDTNGTNVQVPTSSHETDGFVIGEVPTSTEVNGLWANWYAVLAWIYANHGESRWRWRLPIGATTTGTYSAGALSCANSQGALGVSITPAVGEVISEMGAAFATNAGSYAGSGFTISLQRSTTNPSGGAPIVTTLGTIVQSLFSQFDTPFKVTAALTGGNGPGGTTETVVDGAAYYFDFSVSFGSSGPVDVNAVGYQVLDAW